MPRKTRTQRAAKYEGLLQGVKKRWSPSERHLLANKSYSTGEIIALLQSMIDAIRAAVLARATWRDRVAEQRRLEQSLHPVVRRLEDLLRVEAGTDASILADYGLRPARKTGPRTTQAKLVMAAKAKATRASRKTVGKRQRRKVYRR